MTRLSGEEEDQINQLRQFWGKYGNIILTVLIVFFGGYALHNGYKWYVSSQSQEAAFALERVQQAAIEKDIELLDRVWETLSTEYTVTTYPDRAALLVAKTFYNEGKAEQAQEVLRWLIETGDRLEYISVARLTLASLLIETGEFEKAHSVLENKVSPAFEGLFYDRKGDIAFAQKNYIQAKTYYEQSIGALEENNPLQGFVESKIAALPSE